MSDLQMPDHNREAIESIFNFIPDFAPDHVYLVGDVVNFSGVAKYDPVPHYEVSVMDEIHVARQFLQRLKNVVLKANPLAKITFMAGNHEIRLAKFIASKAREIERLEVDGEYIATVSALFQLKKLGIDFVEYLDEIVLNGVIIEHGDKSNKWSGYTAKNMLQDRGMSGISGHTHRAGMHMRTTGKNTKFWIELGCLCNLEPTPHYTRNPDWQTSFGIAYIENNTFYPTLIPMFKNSFVYNAKHYTPYKEVVEKPTTTSVLRRLRKYGTRI